METLNIVQGSTFNQPIRWGSSTFSYAPISAVPQTTPLHLTSTAHGIPEGWRVEIVSVGGMIELNSSGRSKDTDFHLVTVIDADTIELNDINAAGYAAYTTGGYLKYYTPVDLTGYEARMTIKDKIGGTVLVTLTSANSDIEVDVSGYAIILKITAIATAAFDWIKGICDLEMVKGDTVVKIFTANVNVTKEVTT